MIPAPPKPMAADAPAVFEVATIKPSNPDIPGKLFTVKGRQFMTVNTTWTPDDSQFRGLGVRIPAPSTDPNAPPGLFTAIQEQLGLKLESTNAPVEVLVVDHVEKPSAN